MRTRKPQDEGFTLVELLVVGIILAILVGIAMMSYYAATARARTIACEHNQRLFNEAVYVHETQTGTLPTTIDDLDDLVVNFDEAIVCPESDGTLLQYDSAIREVTCANH